MLFTNETDDDLELPVLPDCLNVTNGSPNYINLSLNGTVNDKPALLILDTAADVSMISVDFVSSCDIVACYKVIHGIDKVDHTLPSYLMYLSTHGVKGKCLFASFSKLPSGTVLVGRDCGDTLTHLIDMAKCEPNAVYLTRAQAKAIEKDEQERELRHAVEGATPIPIDSIPDTYNTDFSVPSDSNSDSDSVSSDTFSTDLPDSSVSHLPDSDSSISVHSSDSSSPHSVVTCPSSNNDVFITNPPSYSVVSNNPHSEWCFKI